MRPGRTDRFLVLGIVLALSAPVAARAKSQAPAWLEEAARAPLPPVDPKAPAVVLLDQESCTLDGRGHVSGTMRWAVRVLLREGKYYAFAGLTYRNPGGTVRDLDGWLIRPSGEVRGYGKGDVVDMVAAPNDVYNDVRIRRIDAVSDADVGCVFGYEASYQEDLLVSQFPFDFQFDLPVVHASYSVEAPPDWRVSAVTFNHAPVEPRVEGARRTWELRDIPYIEDEPWMPPWTALAPRLAVSVTPPADRRASQPPSFDSWSELAGWLDDLTRPSAGSDAAISSKVAGITASYPTEYGRIRAIGSYVQSLNYIEIALGTARGGGWRPHPAREVFAKSYGDCKDKANLMKTMLGCAGIESYLAVISANDSARVRPDWPTPLLFDHCIVAIKVSSDSLPTVVHHPSLGPLLFFDPTDPETRLGDLPVSEQGSWTLVISKRGDLVRAPVVPAEGNRCERRVEVNLDADGNVRGHVFESSTGWLSRRERDLFHRTPETEYRREIAERITRGADQPLLTRLSVRDEPEGGDFALDLDFSAPRCAQRLSGGRLLVFKPRMITTPERLALNDSSRKYPFVLRALAVRETLSAKLPDGFAVESLPSPLTLRNSFGSYDASYRVEEGRLLLTRSVLRPSRGVAPSEYAELRAYLGRTRAYEETPVVLSKR